MNIYEIDFHASAIRGILSSLSDGLVSVKNIIDRSKKPDIEQYEIEDALEFANSLWGIGFVTAQVYISSTVSDVRKLGLERSKRDLLRQSDRLVAETDITMIELCDSVANYFKHFEEWDGWNVTNQNRNTITTLLRASITENDPYPCFQAANIIFGNTIDNLDELFDLITSWRAGLIKNSLGS